MLAEAENELSIALKGKDKFDVEIIELTDLLKTAIADRTALQVECTALQKELASLPPA